jgi:cysteinyl-tRNA synthetase
LWLLGVAYRDPLAWKNGALKQAKARYETMAQAHSRIGAWAQELDDGASPMMKPGQVPRKEISEIEGLEAHFRKAMENDFDTPAALDVLERVLVLGAQLAGDRSREVPVRRVAASIALASAASMNGVLQVIEA